METITRKGDIWQLGAHRVICADAADQEAVRSVMKNDKAALLFTSPPYANQRYYTTGGIADWDALMQGVFTAASPAMKDDGQMLVNIGIVHKDYEFVQYWSKWLDWMSEQGWRKFAWYIWDKMSHMPGDSNGRLSYRHEFIFHFNKQIRQPNKIIPCKYAGASHRNVGFRAKDGRNMKWTHAGRAVTDWRIPDSIICVTRKNSKLGHGIDHPAVFPVGLPEFIIRAYTNEGDIVYEPFCGSGSTIIAAQYTGRIARAVEIAPEYVDVIIKRWMRRYPYLHVVHDQSGRDWEDIAKKRMKENERADELRKSDDACDNTPRLPGVDWDEILDGWPAARESDSDQVTQS